MANPAGEPSGEVLGLDFNRRHRRVPRVKLPRRAISHYVRQSGRNLCGGFFADGRVVRPSPLSGTRNIVEVVFAFTNRNTDFTEKFFVRIDVTEEFPFPVTKLLPYYDR